MRPSPSMLACSFAIAAASVAAQGSREVAVPVATVSAPDTVVIATGREGLSLEEMIALWSEATGRKFIHGEETFKGRPRIQITGEISVKRGQADPLFQSMLLRSGFLLVPAGKPGADTWTIEPVQSGLNLKATAPFVPREKLAGLRDQPAQLFVTTFQLQHVRVDSLRAAMSQLLTNRNCEFSAEVPSTNAYMVMGFGPTLAFIDEMLTALDVPAIADMPDQDPPSAPIREKAAKDKDKD